LARRRRTQAGELGLERLDAPDEIGDVCRREKLRDVLRAIRVPGGNRHENVLLGPRTVARRHQPRCQFRIVLDDARFSPDLDALTARVIDQKQTNPRIFCEISLSDVLTIAGKIGKADGLVIEHTQEAGRTAAVLDVRLTLRVRGGDEDAGLRLDECRKVGRDMSRPGPTHIHALV
jgi:hypothetical protein